MVHAKKLMLCGGAMLLAGCGSAAASSATSPTPTAGQRGGGTGAGAGTSGQLVQINGTTLVLSTTNADVNVTYTSTTPITQASTGPTADIVTGSCVVIIGTKDSAGSVTATSVQLRAAVSGACTNAAAGGGAAGGGRPGGGAGFPGRPSGAAAPSGAPTLNPNAAFVNGLVTAVTGTSITVQQTSGTPSTVTVPTTITVNESRTAAASELAVDDCLLARGAKNASGVVAATALTIEPASPSGTCTVVGFGGGRGGFGGRAGGGAPVPTAGA
jgi:hypothetical protein